MKWIGRNRNYKTNANKNIRTENKPIQKKNTGEAQSRMEMTEERESKIEIEQ